MHSVSLHIIVRFIGFVTRITRKCVDTRNFTQRNQIPVKISKKSDVVQERSTKLNVSSCMYHTNKYCKADQLFVLIMGKKIFTLKK
jgi:hypothetical protein